MKYIRYICVIVFTAIIYLTLPFARAASNYLQSNHLFKYSIYLILAIFITACLFIIFRYIRFNLINTSVIAAFFIVYLIIIQRYNITAEKIHFIEYGILSFLTYNAIKEKLSSNFIYLISFIIITVIGWGDEIIQHFLPDRVYDIRDIFLNSLSGGLILILIYIVQKLKTANYNK